MKIKQAQYLLTAVRTEQYPAEVLPAVSFCGRSNVGKSSLINALLNRRNLARTSSQPGKTRTINFFAVDSALAEETLCRWYLVDESGPRGLGSAAGRLVGFFIGWVLGLA